MAPQEGIFWRRHRWFTRLAVACLVVLVVVTRALAVIAHRFQPLSARRDSCRDLQDSDSIRGWNSMTSMWRWATD